MDEVKLNTFDDIINLLTTANEHGHSVFRGVSDHEEHQLIPSLGRAGKDALPVDELEQALLFNFLNESQPYLDERPTTKMRLMAIAQHHGLPTRLMDWSRNPLVAAYFSVYKDPKRDSAIYRYIQHKGIPELTITDDVIKTLHQVDLIIPSHTTRRITVQQGMFTHHPKADEEFTHENMIKFIIPANRKSYIRQKLAQFGVDHSKLFPDLDGLAEHLRWSQRYES